MAAKEETGKGIIIHPVDRPFSFHDTSGNHMMSGRLAYLLALLLVYVAARYSTDPANCTDRINPDGTNGCMQKLCALDEYFVLMYQECPVTCDYCGCKDIPNNATGITSCDASKCSDADYVDRMQKQCRKTCGFCT